ncbi:MAG: MotA/TolQ/ExbB proton channel family protein [Bradymonadia bacterium]
MEIFRDGGVPLYINVLVVSVITIAIIVDRSIAMVKHSRLDVEHFTKMIVKLVKQGNVDQAQKLCNSTTHPMAKVCRAGLSKAESGMMEISASIEEEMMRAAPELEKRISALWAMANIATLIGLIGTIFGLITSFKGLEGISPEEKSAFLARGISEALNNTAIGLSIAVACMIGHLILSSMSKKVLHHMELNASVLENFLLQRSAGGNDRSAA